MTFFLLCLDRRLFSVNAFLSKGHNWVHFSRHMIKLGIEDGPSINIPITSLQSNALVVDHSGIQQSKEHTTLPVSPQQLTTPKKKTNLDTGLLHAMLHRSDGVFVTIRTHDLWRDVNITQSIDPFYTTCKIMTIPTHARGSKVENPKSINPLMKFK